MFQYFYPYRAQATRHIIPRAPLRLPWAMNFCLFEAYPSDRMSSPVMWHTTSSYFPHAKNPWRSFAPTAHQKPSSRQRSKSKESVKRPIRAHREIRVFDKSSPHGHSTSHMPHATFNIQHSTSNTQHCTPNIPHPTLHILNIPPQNLHGFFPPRPTLRSNTPFSHIYVTT